MYQLKYGDPPSVGCACNVGMYGCACLNEEVFGDDYLPDWCWGPVEEDAPGPGLTCRGEDRRRHGVSYSIRMGSLLGKYI